MTTLYDIIQLQHTLSDALNDINILKKMVDSRDEIIDRQRNALQLLLNAIWIHINAPDDNGEQLQDAYRVVSSTSTMTGTTEE